MTSFSPDPLLSVVMPCFNGARYIGEALDSILAQGSDALQIVVVDDGSTDGSMEIARAFGDRVECHSQPHAGIGAARNTGIAQARGRYLSFLDADDLWPADSLKLRLERLRQGVTCVFGAVEHFISPELDAAARQRFAALPATMPARMAGTMLIERAAFDRIGGFDSALKIGEMMDWVARAEQGGLASCLIDAVVLRRRVHGHNTMLRLKHDRGDYLKLLKGSLDRRRAAAGPS